MNLIGRILSTTCVAVVAVTVLAACSTPSKEDNLRTELTNRGFNNIVLEDSIGTRQFSFWAVGNGCHVYLWYDTNAEPGSEWLLIERSSRGEEYDVIVPNPSADKLGEIDAFDYCYTVDTQSSPQESQE